jgi:hypothetical protein
MLFLFQFGQNLNSPTTFDEILPNRIENNRVNGLDTKSETYRQDLANNACKPEITWIKNGKRGKLVTLHVLSNTTFIWSEYARP